MKAHPIELRERIVNAVEQKTQTIEQIAILFNVTERYIYKLLKIHRGGGDLAPKPHGGGAPAKLTETHRRKLAEFIDTAPDATLEELRELLRRRSRLSVSINTVWRAVDALGITVKKRRVAPAKPTPMSEKPSSRRSDD
jgi:transposase